MANNSEFANGRSVLTTEQVWNLAQPRTGNGHADPVQLSFLMWLAAEDAAWQSQVQTYRDYYNGEHKYQLTERMREFLELDKNVKFDLNYLPIAVDTLQERLQLDGFDAAEQGGRFDDDEPKPLIQWCIDNNIQSLQNEVHHAALRDRDAYVVVEWDAVNGRPVFSMNEEYDGSYGMVVRYDESDGKTIKFAVKRWRIESGPGAGTTSRMNIYTADAIYKFISGGRGWEQHVDREGDPWPLPWVDGDGRPLGVPVVHFDNQKSELHDLIPAQDALNKAVIDEIAGADTEGFQIITLSGGSKPDPGMIIGPRNVLWAPQGSWGSIGAGGLSALSAIVDGYIQRMAQISRTPIGYFQVSGQVASGDSQKAGDAPLVSKAENRAVRFGSAWRDMMAMARRIHNTFSTAATLDETVNISPVWRPFHRIDAEESARQAAETARIKAQTFVELINTGVPRQTAAELAGYTTTEAADMASAGGRVLPQDSLDIDALAASLVGGDGMAEESVDRMIQASRDFTPARLEDA